VTKIIKNGRPVIPAISSWIIISPEKIGKKEQHFVVNNQKIGVKGFILYYFLFLQA
jgi:hypothetical protein